MSEKLVQSLAQDIDNRNNGRGAQRGYHELADYLNGQQALRFLHPDVSAQVGDRLTSLVINWPRIVIEAIEQRLDITGFRVGGDSAADDDLFALWRRNQLVTGSQLGHVDAMALGRAFGLCWGDDDGQPRISVESATQMSVLYRSGTTRLEAALKVFADPDDDNTTTGASSKIAWLYLPDSAQKYRGSGNFGTGWKTDGPPKPNPLGIVPVAPIVNRPTLTDLSGQSELTDIIPLADAVNKLGTDMMVSSEYHAMPRRYATGIEIPKNAQVNERLQAQAAQQWDQMTKGKTWLAGKDVNFGQFPEASLENFIAAIRMLEAAIAALGGLPPHYMGLSGDNPASADAIRSAEASLVKRALRKQWGFGSGWEQLMRLAIAVREGIRFEALDPKWDLLETQWADPNTPTPAEKADAAVKLTAGDAPIITRDQAREDLGYTDGQIARMNETERDASAAAATADVRARVALAQTLMAEQGLSQPAAYAAVGLLAAASQMTTGTPSVATGAVPAAA